MGARKKAWALAKRSGIWMQWGGVTAVVAAVLVGVPQGVYGQQAKPEAAVLDETAKLKEQAVALYILGKYDAAIPLAERTLTILENALGKDHPDVAQPLNNLATVRVRSSSIGERSVSWKGHREVLG